MPKHLWQLGKLNHVAIAVPDLRKSMSLYRDVLGAKVSEPEVWVGIGRGKVMRMLSVRTPLERFWFSAALTLSVEYIVWAHPPENCRVARLPPQLAHMRSCEHTHILQRRISRDASSRPRSVPKDTLHIEKLAHKTQLHTHKPYAHTHSQSAHKTHTHTHSPTTQTHTHPHTR